MGIFNNIETCLEMCRISMRKTIYRKKLNMIYIALDRRLGTSSMNAKTLKVKFIVILRQVYYLRQGGYVFASVSLCVCVCVSVSVCVSSTLRKKLLTNFYENFRKGPDRAKEQSIRFWW